MRGISSLCISFTFDPQADGALVCFALELGNILIGVQPLLGYEN